MAIALPLAIDDRLNLLVTAATTLAAPLVAVFLLGMVTRRTTATAALAALVLGILATAGLVAYSLLCVPQFSPAWNAPCAFAFTCAAGYILSFALGRRKPHVELRGLVAGCGTLGIRAIDESVPLITAPDERDERWR